MTDNTKDEREALVAECKRLAGEYAEHYRSTYWLVTGTSPLPWALLQDAIDRLAALPPPDLGHPVALRGGLSDAASQGQQWIPVSERLPKDDDTVLVVVSAGTECAVFTASYWPWPDNRRGNTQGAWEEEDHDGPFQISGVTHWMPLPAPPTSDAASQGSDERASDAGGRGT